MRCYLSYTGSSAPAPARAMNRASSTLPTSITVRLVGADGQVTEVREKVTVKSEKFAAAQWYTLDGRKLSGKPSQKGVYIVNGKKFAIH
ncbi:MAG: hypothetical protein K5683_06760, partial [Prevotella sp.]|nr:hypothetical protein [Prevotella sp.]